MIALNLSTWSHSDRQQLLVNNGRIQIQTRINTFNSWINHSQIDIRSLSYSRMFPDTFVFGLPTNTRNIRVLVTSDAVGTSNEGRVVIHRAVINPNLSLLAPHNTSGNYIRSNNIGTVNVWVRYKNNDFQITNLRLETLNFGQSLQIPNSIRINSDVLIWFEQNGNFSRTTTLPQIQELINDQVKLLYCQNLQNKHELVVSG